MNIIAGGIDYSSASIEIREKFSFTNSRKALMYERLLTHKAVCGSVIISTCNRMEIYLSLKEKAFANPFELLCKAMDIDYISYKEISKGYEGDIAFEHLCMLSCGALSQIFGEDQIITQVKEALVFARQCKATDSMLEVFFRNAVACAKKIRTKINLTERDVSLSSKVVEKIINEKLPIHNVLVIGNGAMGKRAASDLVHHSFSVTMTARKYRYSVIEVPKGVQLIDYHDRYGRLYNFDAVVSATLSPHYTITKDMLLGLHKIPAYYFDLAIPRDIESSISEINNVKVYNVDEISDYKNSGRHVEKIEEMQEYILKYRSDLNKWESYKVKVPTIAT